MNLTKSKVRTNIKTFLDPCQKGNCLNDGDCIPAQESMGYNCACRDAFLGANCEKQPQACGNGIINHKLINKCKIMEYVSNFRRCMRKQWIVSFV